MKKSFVSAALAAAFAVASLADVTPASAAQDLNYQLNSVELQSLLTGVAPLDLINWKVGDNANYQVSAGFFGKIGTMTKKVTSDEGTALWVTQAMALQGKDDVTEILINKADGKILKMKHNGQEQTPPNEQLEIISQDYTDVTVPAGTFKAMHIVAKTAQVKKLEIWANPQATVMDGSLKNIVSTGMIDLTIELTSFGRGQ